MSLPFWGILNVNALFPFVDNELVAPTKDESKI
jgi:hypothetical protein